ncbi:MAG: DUF3035 domain-containing protein [Rhizomicrobium sp.]
MHSRTLYAFALVAGAAVALSGCEQLRSAAGQGKDSPDEFAVVTKAPLVIPPDFNLKPPAPGTAPTNQIEPTQSAQNALFSADQATVASTLPATMSPGERYFLAAAGVQNADPAIRQQIASDARGMRASDDSFANDVLFWKGPSPEPGSTAVDADAEARRVDAARAGTPVAPGAPAAAPQPSLPDDSSKTNDDGWLGGLWPF